MLRRSARSLGSNRRLWEVVGARGFTSSCSGTDYVPSRHCPSPGGVDNIAGRVPPCPVSVPGLEPCSAQSNKLILDEFKFGRGVGARNLRSLFVDQESKSHVQSTAVGDNHKLSRRIPLVASNNLELRTYPHLCVGGSLANTRSVCYPADQRRLSTSKAGGGGDDKSAAEGGAEKTPPRSIEDFQHEEIVGPTVERDLSDTADQVRDSLNSLRDHMASFSTGFLILGTVQLVAALWSAFIKTDPSSIGLWRDMPYILLSFTFAYLLWNARSANDFFTKIEGRSRIRILTLSLQVIKGISQFFYRSGVMVKFVAFTSLLALMKEALPLT
ncbi:hypothetical protein MPTK1_1g14710 [Marchantia polymorpha subsp. ruderalis]|uniref:Uncharacterized protein n=2 Tax=Marchantia polymorpha TaxID=3197 RepID=A0AAF6AQ79_MARPO|nr:hypothetical protein MARPO_0153s0019 [Marchantia polymorpha]BBM98599.1 hypothetical protein Mp_1g14710 [Marchantia polymorpha subsp. ruderalis]|eukprot:PTQ28851.1 hypothetical protein MARPO_0153s0019 [Marchantia polymorpha]